MTGLSRAGFYRWRGSRQATPVEIEVRDQMHKVALEWPAYGYLRITHELQQRGFQINHKLVLRMMREDNLLCVRCVRSHNRLTAQPAGLPEPGARAKALGDQPALGRRYHIHSIAR
jgi:transposase InsO family protein